MRKQIVNSGAIFTSSQGFEAIAAALHEPCPNTNNSNFHGVDQVVLNWLVRCPPTAEPEGSCPVLSPSLRHLFYSRLLALPPLRCTAGD